MAARRTRPGSSREDGSEDEGSGSWADDIDGIRRLPDGADRVADGPARSRRPAAAPATFHFPDPDEPGLGFSSGISNAQQRQLRKGRVRPERRIDLHGLTREEARRACIAELCAAATAGERCVLVVHGKGARSSDGPVLRAALPSWLADPALEGGVLAFAPARPEDGGRGASYVLLRRQRRSD